MEANAPTWVHTIYPEGSSLGMQPEGLEVYASCFFLDNVPKGMRVVRSPVFGAYTDTGEVEHGTPDESRHMVVCKVQDVSIPILDTFGTDWARPHWEKGTDGQAFVRKALKAAKERGFGYVLSVVERMADSGLEVIVRAARNIQGGDV